MQVLVLTVPVNLSEVISDRLWGLGVAAIEERAPAASPTADEPLNTLHVNTVHVNTVQATMELWTSLGEDRELVVSCLEGIGLPPHPGPGTAQEIWGRWEEISSAAIDSWRDHARSFEIVQGVWVIPDWMPTEDRGSVPDGMTEVFIDPGSSFGMGDHPTTRLSLQLLLRYLQTGDHVLDVGCGSGILGIAALLRGAGHVTAIDIAPAAMEATRSNALANGVASRIDVSMTPLENLLTEEFVSSESSGPVRILVANILAPALIALAKDMRRACTREAKIILSGILENNCQHVIDAFSPWSVIDRVSEGGWTALLLAAPSPDCR
jgi:ribosomal protein L11 methyltransferase